MEEVFFIAIEAKGINGGQSEMALIPCERLQKNTTLYCGECFFYILPFTK